jgi:hypothetical protein
MSAVSAVPDSAQGDRSPTPDHEPDWRDVPANRDRLARSRERVRRALNGEQPSDTHDGAVPAGAASEHMMLNVAQVAARRALETLADRHPLPLLGMALAAGGLLVWMRPWRGLLRPALIAGIAARLIARVPAENALALFTSILGSPKSQASRQR